MSQPRYDSNSMLNRELSFDEVVKMTQNLKCRKACGFVKIPNEVLKRSEIHVMLFNMFKIFLTTVLHQMYGKSLQLPLSQKV